MAKLSDAVFGDIITFENNELYDGQYVFLAKHVIPILEYGHSVWKEAYSIAQDFNAFDVTEDLDVTIMRAQSYKLIN